MQINASAVNGDAVNGYLVVVELQALLSIAATASAGINISKPLAATAAIAATSKANVSIAKPLASSANMSITAVCDIALRKDLGSTAVAAITANGDLLIFDYEQWLSDSRRSPIDVLSHSVSVPVDGHAVDATQATTAYVPIDPRAV